MTLDLRAYHAFASRLTIPSRDAGLILFDRPFGTQLAMRKAIAAGWERDIHDFVILKGGRQIGGSTEADALSLYWLQHHHGMVGQMVSDDLPNLKYRRKVMRQMLGSLPRAWRYPINADNLDFLEWAAPCRSTLVFDYAGLRVESNLILGVRPVHDLSRHQVLVRDQDFTAVVKNDDAKDEANQPAESRARRRSFGKFGFLRRFSFGH